MRVSIEYASHMPVLIKALNLTTGPILELGIGLFSTPLLHWLCYPEKRELVSYESAEGWYNYFKRYNSDFHKVILIDNWDHLPMDRRWDVVFIDHNNDRRALDSVLFAETAKYVILHDTEPKEEKTYHYVDVYSKFKYRYDFKDASPYTTVLSNLIDLSDFKI